MTEEFTATHHAMMTAWIARAVINTAGEDEGGRIFRKAVVKYANQRGHRMALRAEANGHPLTMNNYFAYGEWKAGKGEMEMKIMEKNPDAHAHVMKCPWHTAWKGNNLMEYGRYFCMEVDKALVAGFNKDLVLDIDGTRTNGAEFCDFYFREANLTPAKLIGLVWKKTVNPGKKAIMPWEYHIGHLYKTLGEVIGQELAEQAPDIMATAMQDFTDTYGEAAGQKVMDYQNTDFDRLP